MKSVKIYQSASISISPLSTHSNSSTLTSSFSSHFPIIMFNEIFCCSVCTLSSCPFPFLSIQSTSTRPSPTHSSPLKSLKFFSFNARSLFPKFDEFRLSVSSLDPDIICICETWLTNDIQNSEISLPGYSLFRKDRLHKIGGGAAIYAKSNLSSSLIKLSSSLEFILISIFHLDVKLFIGCFYRPPSSPNDTSFYWIYYLPPLLISQITYFFLVISIIILYLLLLTLFLLS